MSAKEHISSSAAMSTMMGSGGIYQSLFKKIHLKAAIHIPLSCLAKSAEDMVRLDMCLLNFHISDLVQKISKPLDVVMHQPDVQHVKSRWHGLRFLKCQKQKPDRAVV